MNDSEVIIRYENVSKRFGNKVVLDGLNLEVRRGETLAIMGPSGIGKSVTLRHAVGLLRPDSGRVTVEGHDMSTIESEDLAEMRRRMGYLFQEGALINWLSVGENVALPLRENTDLGDQEIRRRAEEKLELVQMQNTWDLDAARTVRRHAQARRPGPRPGHGPGDRVLRRAEHRAGP